MRRAALALIPILLLSFGGASCGVGQGRSDKLKQAVTSFNDGLWWGRMQEVMPRLDPDTVESYVEQHKEWGRDIRITGYDIVYSAIDLEKGTARITVRLEWYRNSAMEVHSTTVIQTWEEKEREWFLIAEEHSDGTPF